MYWFYRPNILHDSAVQWFHKLLHLFSWFLTKGWRSSAPLAIGTPGVSPKQNGAGTLSSHGDDESQGVRWGSEDEGIMMTSDEDEAEEDEDDDYDEKAV